MCAWGYGGEHPFLRGHRGPVSVGENPFLWAGGPMSVGENKFSMGWRVSADSSEVTIS